MKTEEIENLIKDFFEKINVKLNSITVVPEMGDNTWFSIEVSEPHIFTTHDGEALSALNHVVRKIIETKTSPTKNENTEIVLGATPNILIDINGFQKKRVDNVRAVAHMMGERARYFKSNIEVDPMSSFERRIVHEFLANANDLKTESVGFGPSRRVVIKYTGIL